MKRRSLWIFEEVLNASLCPLTSLAIVYLRARAHVMFVSNQSNSCSNMKSCITQKQNDSVASTSRYSQFSHGTKHSCSVRSAVDEVWWCSREPWTHRQSEQNLDRVCAFMYFEIYSVIAMYSSYFLLYCVSILCTVLFIMVIRFARAELTNVVQRQLPSPV